MSLIPPNQVTEADLTAWFNAQAALNKAKAAELLLRLKIFGFYFPNPVEGTNTVELPAVGGGPYALKATYPITRKVDPALLDVLTPTLRGQNIPVDSLIKRTPELVLSAYRTLTAEEAKLFDQCMDIKPGTPGMKIEEIKKRKA